MPQQNPTPCATEPKVLDALVSKLNKEVSEAQNQSNDFYSKSSRLAIFDLQCDQEKGEAKPADPEGLLTTLNDLINALHFINRRNLEILQQIDKII
jgi:hypothetical protein